jgi:hypothetical protein
MGLAERMTLKSLLASSTQLFITVGEAGFRRSAKTPYNPVFLAEFGQRKNSSRRNLIKACGMNTLLISTKMQNNSISTAKTFSSLTCS